MTHSARIAQKQIDAPRPVGLWAWSFDEQAHEDEYKGAFPTLEAAMDDADDALQKKIDDNRCDYETGEIVDRDLYLVRFAWRDREKTRRLVISREHRQAVAMVEPPFNPHKEWGTYR